MKPKNVKTAIFIIFLSLGVISIFNACSENDNDDPVVDLSWTDVGEKTTISGVDNDGDNYSITVEIVNTQNGDSEALFIDEIEGDTLILEFRATEKGIYDYVLFEGNKSKPTTLVEYAAEVGTRWEYTVASGTVVRRELMEKGNIYKVLQSYPSSPYEFNVAGIEWEISTSKGIVALSILYTDEDPVRISLN